MDEDALDLETLTDALEHLGEELSQRAQGDFSFSVTVPKDPPVVALLAELINSVSQDWAHHLDASAQASEAKNKELAEAYNAVQARSEEINRDLETARRIQLKLIPSGTDLPQRPEIACGGFYQSMDNVGGDLYDMIRVGRNSYGVLMADVSGHGLPSALITALVKSAFRTRARYGVGPEVICQEVNDQLYPILSDLDYYVTLFFGIVNLENGSWDYVNCGHHPAILIPGNGAPLRELDTRGRFLGAFEDIGAKPEHLILEPGDVVFTYTDGIIESRNFLDEEYGLERLWASLEKYDSILDMSLLTTKLYKDLEQFTMGAPARDDLSMFAMRFVGPVDSSDHGTEGHHNESKADLQTLLRRAIKDALGRGHLGVARSLWQSLGYIRPLELAYFTLGARIALGYKNHVVARSMLTKALDHARQVQSPQAGKIQEALAKLQ